MPDDLVNTLINAYLEERPTRIWSLIISFFGDSVVPYGGTVWLGSMLQVTRAMQLDDRAVRTALSRLARDGWVERSKEGRNSYYSLSPAGREHFAPATRRIYARQSISKPNGWRLITLSDDTNLRKNNRKFLEQNGFGTLAPNIMIAPSTPQNNAFLSDQNGPDAAITFQATLSETEARKMIMKAWRLEKLASGYQAILDKYSGSAGTSFDICSPLNAIIIRTFLIHDYRRVILRDPDLPTDLLPNNWPGRDTADRVAALYNKLKKPADRWLSENLGVERDILQEYRQRFSGEG